MMTRESTRRRVLLGIGTGAAIGLAGCTGGSSEGDTATSGGSGGNAATSGDSSGNTTGSGSGDTVAGGDSSGSSTSDGTETTGGGTSGGSATEITPPDGVSSLSGAGSSFVNPLMQQWAQVYAENYDVELTYQSIGSGGGQNALLDKTVQFAGSDAPLSADQYEQLQNGPGSVHIPESLGAIVPAFRVPEVDSLELTGSVLADIFLGNVTKWNDSAIADLNSGANLPNESITVAHRSDASGTSFGFTDYLSRVSSDWKDAVGASESPNWPTGVGGKGNEGVSGILSKQDHAIGYVELTYATENDIDTVTMKNKAGKFVDASADGAAAALANGANSLPKGTDDWSDVSINNEPGAKTWPISTLTYIITYEDMGKAFGNDVSKKQATADLAFFQWAITDGQQYAPDLEYPKLPDSIVRIDQQTLEAIEYNGTPIVGSQ